MRCLVLSREYSAHILSCWGHCIKYRPLTKQDYCCSKNPAQSDNFPLVTNFWESKISLRWNAVDSCYKETFGGHPKGRLYQKVASIGRIWYQRSSNGTEKNFACNARSLASKSLTLQVYCNLEEPSAYQYSFFSFKLPAMRSERVNKIYNRAEPIWISSCQLWWGKGWIKYTIGWANLDFELPAMMRERVNKIYNRAEPIWISSCQLRWGKGWIKYTIGLSQSGFCRPLGWSRRLKNSLQNHRLSILSTRSNIRAQQIFKTGVHIT